MTKQKYTRALLRMGYKNPFTSESERGCVEEGEDYQPMEFTGDLGLTQYSLNLNLRKIRLRKKCL